MFEACGLYFILRRTDRDAGSVFQLCDEAFSNAPVPIRANSYKSLFAAVEKNIGLALPQHARNAIRLKLGSFGYSSQTLSGSAIFTGACQKTEHLKAVGA